jgi:predicted metal-dependent HD superfamily phosphohydrolase
MDYGAAKAFILEELITGMPGDRLYHSEEHTLDVHDSALQIAKTEGVEGEQLELLATAALFHDSGFLVNPDKHERGSCMLAREHLPRFGYSPQQVEGVCEMIMATTLPQSPEDVLAQILCDADLDYLGRDDFWSIGDRLFRELQMHGDLADRKVWNRMQEAFLAKHAYHTNTAKQLRESKKQEHLARLRTWLQEHA